MNIKDYPLIAVTEVFDMPSVDNVVSDWGTPLELGPTHEVLDSKLREVIALYGWDKDTVFEYPIHVYEFQGEDPYRHSLSDAYKGVRLMGNGHHRLAFQALVQGALFVHYTEDEAAKAY